MNRLLVALLGVLAAAPSVAAITVVGDARRIDGGELVYRELHIESAERREVQYVDPEGRLISFNRLAPGPRPSAPSFLQYDLRFDRCQAVAWRGDLLQFSHSGRVRAREPRPPVVISTGFDTFVRENLDRLAAGESLEFDFPLPSRLDLARLEIERIGRDETGIDEPSADWTLLRIEPASGLLALFVKPIDLAYDDAGRLRVYHGLSNLSAPEGGPLQVRIDYRYETANFAPVEVAMERPPRGLEVVDDGDDPCRQAVPG